MSLRMSLGIMFYLYVCGVQQALFLSARALTLEAKLQNTLYISFTIVSLH